MTSSYEHDRVVLSWDLKRTFRSCAEKAASRRTWTSAKSPTSTDFAVLDMED
ncbi:hypothetical protein [Streptomyces chilikensis]|uniref:Uncharacterized protein n=1 Tax=Streptomyces chilikensis TaxID=1194079 RepID=A0ABV3ELK1_9ACTN